MNFLQVLFSFTGRINRAKFWLAVVFWLVVLFVGMGFVFTMLVRGAEGFSAEDVDVWKLIGAVGSGLVVMALVMIPMFISGIAYGVKRLHDRDKTGWWILLFYFGPSVLDAASRAVESEPVAYVFSIVAFGIAVWGLVELGFLRGTPGPNQYGPDPLPPRQPGPTLPAAMH